MSMPSIGMKQVGRRQILTGITQSLLIGLCLRGMKLPLGIKISQLFRIYHDNFDGPDAEKDDRIHSEAATYCPNNPSVRLYYANAIHTLKCCGRLQPTCDLGLTAKSSGGFYNACLELVADGNRPRLHI